jgi:dihydropteroate synthase-like protein
MTERLLFVTGHLAFPRLDRLLRAMGETPFSWAICNVGVKVAALMTEAILVRRLPRPLDADRVILPGRFRGNLAALTQELGVPVLRGPDEISDLPVFLGRGGEAPDLSRFDIRIFAEIVDASALGLEALVARAKSLRAKGADVIDLGCLPDTPFPHLEDAVRALKANGPVSVDSFNPDELTRGAGAGADFLLSLDENTLGIADNTGATAILVGAPVNNLDSLVRAAAAAERRGLPFIADPILDPVHFGFADSLARYVEARRRLPGAELMMGTGNLTELTEVDSGGVAGVLLGLCSELKIRNVLTVQVSPHTRRTIEEHDAARRLMFAAAADGALPKGYGAGLLQLHDKAPWPATPAEIAEMAAEVRDANFRIATAEDGIHVYNRDGHHVARDAFSLFRRLGVETDGPHAFYLGAELAKAEIAFALGKRYTQDEALDWGRGADLPEEDRERLRKAGHTLRPKE